MKIHVSLKNLLRASAAALFFATSAALNAQVIPLTFSGGNFSTVSITLSTAVSYTVGTSPTNNASNSPFFVFQGVANFGGGGTFSSAPSFTVSRGGSTVATIAVEAFGNNQSVGSIATNDIWFRSNAGGFAVQVGDIVTLNAGTFTTAGTFNVSLTNGSFSSFLADGNGNNLAGGSAIPEPSTYAVFLGVGALGVGLWRRRRSQLIAAATIGA